MLRLPRRDLLYVDCSVSQHTPTYTATARTPHFLLRRPIAQFSAISFSTSVPLRVAHILVPSLHSTVLYEAHLPTREYVLAYILASPENPLTSFGINSISLTSSSQVRSRTGQQLLLRLDNCGTIIASAISPIS
jgi:hypothetical protein